MPTCQLALVPVSEENKAKAEEVKNEANKLFQAGKWQAAAEGTI